MRDIIKYVIDCLETDGEADCRVEHIHAGTLLIGEGTEDGAGGMDGKRLVVEEVGGTTHKLQAVDEAEAGILVGKVDGHHGTRCLAKLLNGELVVWIVLQTYVGDVLDGLERTQALCQLERIGCLLTVAHVESLQSDGLHVGHVGSHVGAKVEQHL